MEHNELNDDFESPGFRVESVIVKTRCLLPNNRSNPSKFRNGRLDSLKIKLGIVEELLVRHFINLQQKLDQSTSN